MNGQKVVKWQKGVILYAKGMKPAGCGKVFRLSCVKVARKAKGRKISAFQKKKTYKKKHTHIQNKKKHANEIYFTIT